MNEKETPDDELEIDEFTADDCCGECEDPEACESNGGCKLELEG